MQQLITSFFLIISLSICAMENENSASTHTKITAHHLLNLYKPLPAQSQRTSQEVKNICWLPNGNQIAVATKGSSNFTLLNITNHSLTWDPRSFFGKQGKINSIAWNPHGKEIIAAFENDTPALWHLQATPDENSNVAPTVEMLSLPNSVMHIAWSPDGTKIATVRSGSNAIQIWNKRNAVLEAHLVHGIDRITGVLWNNSYIAMVKVDGTFYLYQLKSQDDENNYELIKSINARPTSSIASGPDDLRIVAACGSDVIIVDTEKNDTPVQLTQHKNRVNHIAWNHKSNLIASASDDREVRILDPKTRTCLSTLILKNCAVCADFNTSGNQIITADENGLLAVWDIEKIMSFKQDPLRNISRPQKELLTKIFENGQLIIDPKDKQLVDLFNQLPPEIKYLLRKHKLVDENEHHGVIKSKINNIFSKIFGQIVTPLNKN